MIIHVGGENLKKVFLCTNTLDRVETATDKYNNKTSSAHTTDNRIVLARPPHILCVTIKISAISLTNIFVSN